MPYLITMELQYNQIRGRRARPQWHDSSNRRVMRINPEWRSTSAFLCDARKKQCSVCGVKGGTTSSCERKEEDNVRSMSLMLHEPAIDLKAFPTLFSHL